MSLLILTAFAAGSLLVICVFIVLNNSLKSNFDFFSFASALLLLFVLFKVLLLLLLLLDVDEDFVRFEFDKVESYVIISKISLAKGIRLKHFVQSKFISWFSLERYFSRLLLLK